MERGRGGWEKLTLIRVINSALDVMDLQTPIFYALCSTETYSDEAKCNRKLGY
jgi:hypothetical protein